MLLMKRNATVTVVHTKTVDMAATCKHAEILVAAAGSAKMIKPEYVAMLSCASVFIVELVITFLQTH